jgi:hypothetical protein
MGRDALKQEMQQPAQPKIAIARGNVPRTS